MNKKKEVKVVRAHAKYIRTSPLKARRVARLIKKKKVVEARSVLINLPHKAAGLLLKALNSAIANGVNNFNMDLNKLTIDCLLINEAPSFKRHRFRARGRIDAIKKRNSHFYVELKEG